MSYSFRFRILERAKAEELARVLSRHRPLVHQRFDEHGYCLSVRLSKHAKAQGLAQVMRRHGIKREDTDVFASLLAQKDTDIIELPELITEVLRATRLQLTFSFTYVDGDRR